MEIISRADAKARGLKGYFTGKPCRRGHIARRFVCDYTCADCHRDSTPPRAKAILL